MTKTKTVLKKDFEEEIAKEKGGKNRCRKCSE
jgi:hypothetical protein